MDIILKNQILAPIASAIRAVMELEGIPAYIELTAAEAVKVLEDLNRSKEERERMQIDVINKDTTDPRLTIYAKNFDTPAAESIVDKWRRGLYTFKYRSIPMKVIGFERYEDKEKKEYPF